MTSRSRRIGAAWLVAPVAAGSLAISADWAVRHDPMQASASTVRPAADALQRQAQRAAQELGSSQRALAALESSVHQRSMRLVRLDAYIRAIREIRGLGTAGLPPGGHPAPGSAAPAPATTPLQPPVAVPPPVSTTTGAS